MKVNSPFAEVWSVEWKVAAECSGRKELTTRCVDHSWLVSVGGYFVEVGVVNRALHLQLVWGQGRLRRDELLLHALRGLWSKRCVAPAFKLLGNNRRTYWLLVKGSWLHGLHSLVHGVLNDGSGVLRVRKVRHSLEVGKGVVVACVIDVVNNSSPSVRRVSNWILFTHLRLHFCRNPYPLYHWLWFLSFFADHLLISWAFCFFNAWGFVRFVSSLVLGREPLISLDHEIVTNFWRNLIHCLFVVLSHLVLALSQLL